MSESVTITEADILDQIVVRGRAGLHPDVARSILDIQFGPDADERMKSLLKKNNAGTISDSERGELEKYLRVGQFIDLLQAKARLALRSAESHM
jgi:hypothetical protein